MDERPQFRVELEPSSDGLAVLALAGEVDIYTAPQFKQTLKHALDAGAFRLIADLASVTFIDSTALGVLVSGVKRLLEHDGALAVVCSDVNITRLFEITGLDRIFVVCATREAAAKALTERASS